VTASPLSRTHRPWPMALRIGGGCSPWRLACEPWALRPRQMPRRRGSATPGDLATPVIALGVLHGPGSLVPGIEPDDARYLSRDFPGRQAVARLIAFSGAGLPANDSRWG